MIRQKKFGFLKAVMILAGLFLFFNRAQAATSTVRGAAWWGDQYKYLYFDCLDDVIGDKLDVEGNLTTPPGFHFFVPPCTALVHHVYISDNGNFSGSAWNYSTGLVNFSGAATPPESGYSFNSHCPNTCDSSNNCWACYNENDQRVYGWARATDGTWIRLDSATTTPVMLQSWDISTASSTLPGYNILPGDFVGVATSSLGDLSFNCKSEGVGDCVARDYKVYVSNLQVGHMSAPNWSYGDACAYGAAKAYLKWNLKSGTQAGYEIVVNNSSSSEVSTSSAVCWSGHRSGGATQYQVPSVYPEDINCQTLDYNTNYYWWVRLYDADGAATEWYQYGAADGHNGVYDSQTSGDPDGDIKTFTTYLHEFPTPYFSWSPFDVLVGTSTEFTSASPASQFYTSGAPALPQSCYSVNCRYLWATGDSAATISSTTAATASIIFFHATGTTATLTITDSDNYVCSSSTPLVVNFNLPIWREVKAQ